MDSAKYRNLFQCLKIRFIGKAYKTRQNDSAKICKKVRVLLKIRVLVLRGQGERWHSASTTCYHRGRESEGRRRVPLCSFLWTRRPTTVVPVYSAWSDRVVFAVYTKLISHDGACHAFLCLESLRRENIFCFISVSIEYSIIFIAVFVDKLQKQESCMHKCLVH